MQCECGEKVKFTGRRNGRKEYETECSCGKKEWVPGTELSAEELALAEAIFHSAPKMEVNKEKKIIAPTYITQRDGGTNPFPVIFKGGVLSVFKEILPKIKSGYVPRPAQMELALKIYKTLYRGGILISEAGVGTGKTFAYSVPAILNNDINDMGPIVITTNTISLQEQLTGDSSAKGNQTTYVQKGIRMNSKTSAKQ